jgi:hypothetical protein
LLHDPRPRMDDVVTEMAAAGCGGRRSVEEPNDILCESSTSLLASPYTITITWISVLQHRQSSPSRSRYTLLYDVASQQKLMDILT